MTLFALQVVLILVAAFLAGCLAGCLSCGAIRRRHANAVARLDTLAEPERQPTEAPPCDFQKERTVAPVPATADGDLARSDDLKRLSGVGPKLERKLHMLGITRFEQVAAWEKTDIDRVDAELRFKGRIEREGWVAQAKLLAADGAIKPGLKPAGKSAGQRRVTVK